VTMRTTVREIEFRAMGSDAHLVVVGGSVGLVERARARVEELEQRWSRFLPGSEVSELTRRAGTAVTVSPDTMLLVDLAIEAFRLSGGSFDPTVLGDVVRAGYDRSFDALDGRDQSHLDLDPMSSLTTGCGDIQICGSTVCLPAGTGFDPGGIGKGLAADLVTEDLLEAGAEGACVNLGGDVRVRGTGPDHGPWTVAVEHPWSPEPIARFGLLDGAVATSTSLKRRWVSGGEVRHHLIDPGTGRPSDSDLTLVAAVAPNAWVAEIMAKSVLLRGTDHPFDLIGGIGTEALAVDAAGRIQASDGLPDFLGARLAPFISTPEGSSLSAPSGADPARRASS